MKRIRIHMLATVDQLQAGSHYNIPSELANLLIWKGKASAVYLGEFTYEKPEFEVQTAGPSETKPITPEVKPRKKAKRA